MVHRHRNPCRVGFGPNGAWAFGTPNGQIKILPIIESPPPSDHIDILAALGISSEPAGSSSTLPSFNDLAKLSKRPHEKPIWQLGSILFDPIQSSGDAYLDERSRMEALSQWLAASMAEHEHLFSQNPVLQALLLKNDLHKASIEARLLGFPRLACLISMAQCDPSLRRACFERQLLAWQHDPDLIDPDVWQIYELLAGRIEALLGRYPDLPWTVCFAAYFWFGLAGRPYERLQLALQFAPPPSQDIRLYMIALFADNSGAGRLVELLPLETVLGPSSMPPTSNGYFLPWALGRMLDGITRFRDPLSQQKLDSLFGEELEFVGLPTLAHQITKDPSPLLRHQIQDGPFGKVSLAWALRYNNASQLDQFNAFADAQDWLSASEILATQIGPQSIISKDDDGLYDALIRLPKDYLERSSYPRNSSLFPKIVAAYYLYLSLRVQQDHPSTILQKLTDMLESLPKRRLNEPSMLMPRIALSLIKDFLWDLSKRLGLNLEFKELTLAMALSKAESLL
jgi:hypothetical protein